MKYALIIPDGAADLPIEQFSGKTVLEAADVANLDRLANIGRVGMVKTVPDGMTPGSDVAIMSLLGYDPKKHYTGRAPIEAAAMGIATRPDQIVFRCNLVTINDGVMEDFSAGHISSAEAKQLIECVNDQLGSDNIRFYPGLSYRHIMVTGPPEAFDGLRTTEPHDIMGSVVKDYLPRGRGSDLLNELMSRSAELLGDHEVNQVRRELGENPATSIWLWGQGQKPALKPFRTVYGPTGAIISAVDLVRGLGKLTGFSLIEVPGATGYLDTNYSGKGRAACEALDRMDMVVVHVEAPDEAGHNADPQAKKLAVERIDQEIVAPVVAKLEGLGQWRIMVLPDHATPISVRSHTADPVPFVIAGSDVVSGSCRAFDEAHARQSDLHVDPGWQLMQYFLRV